MVNKVPFPLGVYVGNPNGSSAAAETQFESDFSRFSSLMGTQPTFLDLYVDQTQPISQWVNNAGWQAWSAAQSPIAQGLTPVIGFPMASSAPGSLTPDQYYKNFAAGLYDSVISGVIKQYADNGFTTQYWRPGWEFNLNIQPHYAGNDPTTQADWVAAFQHIANVMHAAGATDGVRVEVVWNPSITNYTNAEATKALYPGNQYVDVIGADVYSDLYPYIDGNANGLIYDWDKSGQMLNSPNPVFSTLQQWASDPINLEHYYEYPASGRWSLDESGGHALTLSDLIDFAKAQGKPFAISETGAGSTSDGAGVGDNSVFVKWLHNTLVDSGAQVSFVNIWDSNGGSNYEFSSAGDNKPSEAAAWAQSFGSLATGLVLEISEDAWQGDAQYTISLDGQQIGGVMTASASHASGQTQAVAINTTLSAGQHTVSVNFLNDAYGGSSTTDRNLYIDNATINGQTIAGSTIALYSRGAQSFMLPSTSTTPAATPTPTTTNPLVLEISEDAWQGDAQYTISLDGQQIGGVMTASASHASGQTQAVAINTTLSAGQHTVSVNFLNDAYGGSSTTDRNLYIDNATINGQTIAGSTIALYSQGTKSFGVTTASALVLEISEDAYQGNAQYTVAIDGQSEGGIMTASALHASGQTQAVSFNPVLKAGSHTVAISFLNDAYGGSPTTDRNLYLDNATLNGATVPGSTIAIYGQSTSSFNMVVLSS